MRMRPPVCAGARARARVPAPCARLHSTRPQATATAQPGLACANAHAAPARTCPSPPSLRPPARRQVRSHDHLCARVRARARLSACVRPPAPACKRACPSVCANALATGPMHPPALPCTPMRHIRANTDARTPARELRRSRPREFAGRACTLAHRPARAHPPPPTRQPAPMRRPQSHTPMAPPPPAARPADDDHSGEVLGRPSPFQGRVSARTARDAKVSLGTEAKQR